MLRTILTLALIIVAAFTYGCGEDATSITNTSALETDGSTLLERGGLPGRGMVLRLVGDAEGYPGTVLDIDGDGIDDEAVCFDLDVLDASGRTIGTATDCLSQITSVGDGMKLVGTTTFRLGNGSFTSRGSTTVQPATTDGPTPATHITGAIPMSDSNGVIAGTGAYQGFEAEVRLSGAVNLSRLDTHGRIVFDCLFSVNPLD